MSGEYRAKNILKKANQISGLANKGNLKGWSDIAKDSSLHADGKVKDDSGMPEGVGRNGDWHTPGFKECGKQRK